MRTPINSPIIATALIALSFAGYAHAAGASVKASDQKATADTVTIADADLPQSGFLVIHPSDANGNLIEKDIGHIALSAGDHKSVKVTLTGTYKPGDKLWAMLHEDTGTKGVYQFGAPGKANVDMPLKANGKVVEQSFKLL
jgi:hypothetical protein